MQDQPKPDELVALAADFLRTEILPVTEGATGFQLRVAINALELVVRQLRHQQIAQGAMTLEPYANSWSAAKMPTSELYSKRYL